MKQPTFVFLLTIVLFLSSRTTYSQVAKHFSIDFNGTLFSQQKDQSSNYTIYPVPEIEVLYTFLTFKNFSTKLGIKYSYNHWHKEVGVKSEWRLKSHEIIIPLNIEQEIGNYILLVGGASMSYLVHGKKEYKNNIPANPKWEEVTNQTSYNEESKISFQLFLAPKLKFDFDNYNRVSIGPTLNYKLVDNWMKEVRPTTMFGLSIQYTLNL